MKTVYFEVDNSEVLNQVVKLEKMHRSALPVTVRRTLNDMALDARANEVQKVFRSNFIIRQKTFINSHMGANLSRSELNIDRMEAQVGVIKNKSGAGDRLWLQEIGGSLPKREKIPQDEVRIARDNAKKVRRAYYMAKYKNAPTGMLKRTKRETIIKTEWGVYKITPNPSNRKKGTWNTLYKLNRNIKVDKKAFVKPGSITSHRKGNDFFIRNAKKKRGVLYEYNKKKK